MASKKMITAKDMLVDDLDELLLNPEKPAEVLEKRSRKSKTEQQQGNGDDG